MRIETPKPVIWIASAKKNLLSFPEEVKETVGYALYLAQCGEKHESAKPLKGFSGANTLEIIEDHKGSTYRAVYTVKLEDKVYVLHCFQKKSKSGIATPKPEIELIKQRLKVAKELHSRKKG